MHIPIGIIFDKIDFFILFLLYLWTRIKHNKIRIFPFKEIEKLLSPNFLNTLHIPIMWVCAYTCRCIIIIIYDNIYNIVRCAVYCVYNICTWYYATARKLNVRKFCQQYARHRHFTRTAAAICDNGSQSRGKLDKWQTLKLSYTLSCILNLYGSYGRRVNVSRSSRDISICNT